MGARQAEAGKGLKATYHRDPFTDLRFHDLRQTAGVPIERVKARVGHCSPSMTRHSMHLFGRVAHSSPALA